MISKKDLLQGFYALYSYPKWKDFMDKNYYFRIKPEYRLNWLDVRINASSLSNATAIFLLGIGLSVFGFIIKLILDNKVTIPLYFYIICGLIILIIYAYIRDMFHWDTYLDEKYLEKK